MSAAETASDHDVIIIGAGPAGLAAATVTASAGLDTLLLDENAGPGGQIYRAITTTPVKKRHVLGEDYWKGTALVDAARASGARIEQGATVWSLDPDLVLGVSTGGRSRMLKARRVIIATGAIERPFPIPGWTLPGVMTAGAAQTMLKSAGLVPAGRTIIAGTGPLLWLLAAQILRAGGSLDAILDTTGRSGLLNALPHAAGFVLSPLLTKGLSLKREVRSKVEVVTGVTSIEAAGEGKVRSVTYRTRGGASRTRDVDTLLLHQGVVPNVNLALAAGIEHTWDPMQLCWRPVLDVDGGTSVPGIAIAGDGAGIAGALAAEERGRLAAIAAARALAPSARVPDEQVVRQRLAKEERARAFLDTMFQPPRPFRIPAPDTIVCRCEEVMAREVRDTVGLGCEGPNQLKAFLRCGMGPCQGRLCGLTVTELIADERGVTPEAVGYFRLRSPVKPIALGELADMPVSDAEAGVGIRS